MTTPPINDFVISFVFLQMVRMFVSICQHPSSFSHDGWCVFIISLPFFHSLVLSLQMSVYFCLYINMYIYIYSTSQHNTLLSRCGHMSCIFLQCQCNYMLSHSCSVFSPALSIFLPRTRSKCTPGLRQGVRRFSIPTSQKFSLR